MTSSGYCVDDLVSLIETSCFHTRQNPVSPSLTRSSISICLATVASQFACDTGCACLSELTTRVWNVWRRRRRQVVCLPTRRCLQMPNSLWTDQLCSYQTRTFIGSLDRWAALVFSFVRKGFASKRITSKMLKTDNTMSTSCALSVFPPPELFPSYLVNSKQ